MTNACEVVDKILYRSGSYVTLTATGYNNDNAAFRDAAGAMLSDHYPISASFSWSLNPSFQLSEQFGGPHGTYFTDVVPARARAIVLSLQAGSRVDRIGLTLQDGTTLAHGGTGGTARTLALGADEYASSLYLCRGVRNEHTRIFYARFTTNLGRTLAGGSTTSDCTTFAAPASWQIAGFHGRSGAELDKVGVIYTQR